MLRHPTASQSSFGKIATATTHSARLAAAWRAAVAAMDSPGFDPAYKLQQCSRMLFLHGQANGSSAGTLTRLDCLRISLDARLWITGGR